MFTFPFGLYKSNTFLNLKSLLLGGTNENIEIPFDAGDFGQTNNISVTAWMKTSTTSQMAVFAHYATVGNLRKWLLGTSATGFLQCAVSADGGSANIKIYDDPTTSLDDGAWHHIAFTFTTNTLTLYVNGTVVGTPTKLVDGTVNSLFAHTGVLRMGAVNAGTVLPYTGNIDEPLFWDKQLSAAEISEIYNSGTPADPILHSAAANLKEWWRNGDDPADDATDGTGVIVAQISGNDGIPRNTEAGDIVIDVP